MIEKIKENKNKILLTTALILLPLVFGVVIWNRLPEQIPSDWATDGSVVEWSTRSDIVFRKPLCLLFVHCLLILLFTSNTITKEGEKDLWRFWVWVCPFFSLSFCGLEYADVLGRPVTSVCLAGVVLIFLGRALFRGRFNWLATKVQWLREHAEQWNAFCRQQGKFWIIGGAFVVATSFLSEMFSTFVLQGLVCVSVLLVMGSHLLRARGEQ